MTLYQTIQKLAPTLISGLRSIFLKHANNTHPCGLLSHHPWCSRVSEKKNIVHRIRSTILIGTLFCGYTFASPIEDQQQFIHMLATRDHVSPYYTRVVLSHAKLVPSTITKITTPYEAQPFNIYITHFLTPERIAGGVEFWREHQRVLMQAQARYGVSPYMITAILGIETVYGKKQGATPVLDSLYTLAFYYPPRARFFRAELAQYLIMCYDKRISPYDIRGSYAGAFGMPQFMPSSYRIYSVAYNGYSAPDIVHNTNDAIMSIANYFAKRGWRPSLSYAGQLKVIMRYNTSIDYAKTAYLLAQAIQTHANRS